MKNKFRFVFPLNIPLEIPEHLIDKLMDDPRLRQGVAAKKVEHDGIVSGCRVVAGKSYIRRWGVDSHTFCKVLLEYQVPAMMELQRLVKYIDKEIDAAFEQKLKEEWENIMRSIWTGDQPAPKGPRVIGISVPEENTYEKIKKLFIK